MNREEQIQRASEQYPLEKVSLGSVLLAFKDGALWADDHPKEEGVEMWVARDKNQPRNTLILWDKEPFKNEECGFFFNESSFSMDVYSDAFPELTFENSPQRVRLTLVKE